MSSIPPDTGASIASARRRACDKGSSERSATCSAAASKRSATGRLFLGAPSVVLIEGVVNVARRAVSAALRNKRSQTGATRLARHLDRAVNQRPFAALDSSGFHHVEFVARQAEIGK